jgi:hypothetical protein
MPTEIDHNNIKDRIVLILKAKATLYDSAQTTADKLHLISTGTPDGDSGLDNILPSCYVTNSNPLERIKISGSKTGSSESLPPLSHQFRYKIVFAVNADSSRDAELKLDDFQKLILETLEADHQLKNGGAAVVNDSRPETVELFKNELNGKPVQGKIITYLLTKVTI